MRPYSDTRTLKLAFLPGDVESHPAATGRAIKFHDVSITASMLIRDVVAKFVRDLDQPIAGKHLVLVGDNGRYYDYRVVITRPAPEVEVF